MLQKFICLLAVTSFVPFTSYADDVNKDDKAMVQPTEVEGQLLAGCGCGKKNKDNESDEEQLIQKEEQLLAGCKCGKKKKDKESDEEEIVEEEGEVLAHHDGEHNDEEEVKLAACPGKCVPPQVEETEEEPKLAACPKCVPPNKHIDGDDEEELIEEEQKKIA